MDFMPALDKVVGWFNGFAILLIPIAMTLFTWAVLRRRDALDRHALQNTAATIVVVALNTAVLVWFIDDINTGAQAVYDLIGLPKLPADFWSTTPFWLVCLLAIATKDFADYVLHRLMHKRWLWPTHAAHHSDTHVNAFTTYRVHFLETVLMTLNYVVMLTWLQMPEAIPLVSLLASIHNMYVHMDVDIDHGPLKYLIASPRFHRWHHADAPEAYGKNLANLMPVYDLIFGTYYMPGTCRKPMGALSSGIEDKDPFAIFLYPLREWTRLIRSLRPAPRTPIPAQPTIPAE